MTFIRVGLVFALVLTSAEPACAALKTYRKPSGRITAPAMPLGGERLGQPLGNRTSFAAGKTSVLPVPVAVSGAMSGEVQALNQGARVTKAGLASNGAEGELLVTPGPGEDIVSAPFGNARVLNLSELRHGKPKAEGKKKRPPSMRQWLAERVKGFGRSRSRGALGDQLRAMFSNAGRYQPLAAAVDSEQDRLEPRPAGLASGNIRDRKLTDIEFVLFDIETTGLFAEVNGVTQLGAVKFRLTASGELEIIDTYEEYVDPEAPIPAGISEYTAITNRDVNGSPSIAGVLRGGERVVTDDDGSRRTVPVRSFMEFLGDAVPVAHNAPFDTSFLAVGMDRAGLAMPTGEVLDTWKLLENLFPEIDDQNLEHLIDIWGLGGFQTHTGLSDSLLAAEIIVRSAARIAERGGGGIEDLTFKDLEEHSPKLRFDTIIDERLAGKPLPHGEGADLPADWLERLWETNQRLYGAGQPAQIRDIAHELGYDYEKLRAALATEAAAAEMAEADAIVEDILENPPAAVLLNYDKSMTDLGADGLSLPAPEYILYIVNRLLEAGIPVGIISARTFDYQPEEAFLPGSETPIPFDIWTPLISRIPAGLRRNLFFSGDLGSELVVFDRWGKPSHLFQNRWGEQKRAAIGDAVRLALEESGIHGDDVTFINSLPAQGAVVFKGDDERVQAFARKLAPEMQKIGIRVMRSGEWVYFSRGKKETGAQAIFVAMRERGFDFSEEDFYIVADEFHLPANQPPGGDVSVAKAFENARAATVGDLDGHRDDPLPPNVRRVGIKGSRGTERLLKAMLAGHLRRPRPSRYRDPRFVLALGGALLSAAAALAASTLFGPVDVSAALGSAAFTLIGIPQIVKNFREGRDAVQDVSLGTTLIWFSVASLLTGVSIINGSHGVWVASNIASLLQSLVVGAQILYHDRRGGVWWRSMAVFGAVATAVPLLLSGLIVTPEWGAGMLSTVAIALVLLFNWPQIRYNYQRYAAERILPDGLSPLWPILVVAGSLFHLIASIALVDVTWLLSSIASLVTASIVVGQIYWPRYTNAAVGLVLPNPRSDADNG